MSGFAIMLPRKLFTKDQHTLRLVARDMRGAVREVEALVNVEEDDLEDERRNCAPSCSRPRST